MMETALSMRDYTTKQIKPLLIGEKTDTNLHPQIVPAYAATESFNYLRAKYPEYSYKEATLNPTNPRDRPADWEADVIRYFRDNPNVHSKSRLARYRQWHVVLSGAADRRASALPGVSFHRGGGSACHGGDLRKHQRIRMAAQ